jgi:O-antigen/teichoic acid export membrane protein
LNLSRSNSEFRTGNTHTIPPVLTLPSKESILQQDGHQLLAAEELVSSLDTVPLPAIRPEESQQQQEVFIDALVEDISLQATLRLPIIVLPSGKQTLSEQRQIIASTAGSAAIAGAGDLIFAVMRYVTNIVMTNVVSQTIYGTYVTVYTSATIIGTIAELGLSNSMVRFLPTYRAKGEHGLAAGLLRFVVWMTLISGLLCGALFYFSATILAHLVYHQDAYVLPFREIAVLVPMIALQLVLASGLQALKVIKWKVLVDRLIQPVLSLIFIGVFYLLGLRLEGLILAITCGFLASVIAGQILLHKASKRLIHYDAARFEPRTWLRFALPMSLNSFILNVLNSTDVLFLSAFATAAQVGLYAAADRVSFLISMPSLALRVIFSPLIAEYYARGEHEQLANLARLVMKWIFTLSCPLCLCFCIFHDSVLGIFSRGYTAAGMTLIILSFGNLTGIGTAVTGNLLMMMGKTRVLLVDSVTTIVVNIGLAFWLVPRFNVIGAAVATTLTVIILNVLAFIEVCWLVKIVTLRWDMLKSLAAGGVASLVGLLLLRVIHIGYGYKATIGVLALFIPFILVYALALNLLRFSEEDKVVFDAILVKFGKKPSA